MKVAAIRIHNVLKLEHLEFRPSPEGVTIIRGPSDAGKTSALKALADIFAGGHQAELLRHGATERETVLVLDDGSEVRKTGTAEASDLEVRPPKGGSFRAPKSWLEDRLNTRLFDPVQFLQAKPKQQIEMILKACPPLTTQEELERFAAEINWRIGAHSLADPLGGLEEIRQEIYDSRTAVNSEARAKRQTERQLREKLPSEEELAVDWNARAIELSHCLAEFSNAKERACEKARQERHAEEERVYEERKADTQSCSELATKARTRIAGDYSARQESLRARVEDLVRQLATARAEYAELEENLDLDMKEIDRNLKEDLSHIDSEMVEAKLKIVALEQASIGKAQEDFAIAAEPLRAELAEARAAGRELAIAHNNLKMAREFEAEARAKEERSEELTAALEKIQAYKAKLLDAIPIPGLNISNGELWRHGYQIKTLADSERLRLGVEVAAFTAGELKLVLADGLEKLDSDALELFDQLTRELGLQVIGTRVEDLDGIQVKGAQDV